MYYTDIKHFEQLIEDREEHSAKDDTVLFKMTTLVSALLIVLLTSL